ncbi:MAG TPA: nucleoside hydrolase [Candidatus Omnitrophota bacterium]|nr:nucleoside hydrolase [Candidatus Omnitrophota bacterium]
MSKFVQPILFDTDVGWDDVMSILLMMKNPAVSIAGISVTGCGETHLEDGVAIARGLLALADNKAPVCPGAARPSLYDHVFPASFRAQMDDVMGLRDQLPPPCTPPDPRDAVTMMLDVLESSPVPVVIISIGGMTNIAAMLKRATPKQLANILRISIMGGAVYTGGNVAALNNAKPEWNQGPVYATNVTAEWNMFIDPLAAWHCFNWPTPYLPLELVPLDACNNVILSPEYADMIKATDPVANFLKEVIIKKTGTAKEPDPVPVFDPLATTWGVGLLTKCTVQQIGLDVVYVESLINNASGQTFVSPANPPRPVVTVASEVEFKEVFARLANNPPV